TPVRRDGRGTGARRGWMAGASRCRFVEASALRLKEGIAEPALIAGFGQLSCPRFRLRPRRRSSARFLGCPIGDAPRTVRLAGFGAGLVAAPTRQTYQEGGDDQVNRCAEQVNLRESVPNRCGGGGRSGVDGQLGEQVRHVEVDGAWADEELLGDLAV